MHARAEPGKPKSAAGTKETARPALPYDCFRPETRPAADALGGQLMTHSGHCNQLSNGRSGLGELL